jgi:hypothetical protein
VTGASRPLQQIAALALLALLLALLYGAAVQPVLQRQAADRQRLEQARATLARNQALLERKAAILAELESRRAARPAAPLHLSGASPSQAAAALQALIKEAALAAGTRLDSVEALSGERARVDGPARLVVRARLTADTRSLQAMLHRLEAARPLLLVDQLYVRSRSGRTEDARLHLDVRFDVTGFLGPEAAG